MRTVASALTDRGYHREGNEDQYLIDESLGLYVVCDGMGGHACGEVAAERAIQFASQYVASHGASLESATASADDFSRVMKTAEEAVQSACHEVNKLSQLYPEYAGMGTTMTMLLIIGDKAVMAHVGDSRLYLKREGTIHQLSVDHTLANELYLSGAMSKKEAAQSRYQHVLTRSVGPHESVLVDTLLFDLLPGDRFLLCSDGLSNYFDDEQHVNELLAEPKVVEQPEQLIEFAKQRGGADNITAIVGQMLADSDDRQWHDAQLKLQRLGDCFLSRNLSATRLMHLLAIGTTIHCAAGCELMSRGDRCSGLHLILDGAFRLIDDDVIEGELTGGDCFGETSLVSPGRASASLIATRPSRVLLIARKPFDRLTRRMPRLGNALLRNLSRRLSEQLGDVQSGASLGIDDTQPLL